MRITSISVFQVDLPFAGGTYRLSGGREYRSFDATVVRIETDAGIEGWGESTPFGSNYIAAHARGVRAGIAELAPALIGLDPRRVDRINDAMDDVTGVLGSAEAVLGEEPDVVILATGSELRPSAVLPGPVPAIDVDALLERGVPTVEGRSALVLDDEGGFLAPTAAEHLVAAGFAVEIATTHPAVGAEIDPTQQPLVFRRLALADVAMTPHLAGVASDRDGVTLRNIYTERDERRDGTALVVMAGHRRAVVDLRDELATLRPELRVVPVGDALAPRTLLDAVAEGARAGADA